MELKRLLLSVISWSLTTLAAVGTSVSLLGAESESKDAPFTAVELAKKTHYFVTDGKFWKVEKGEPVPSDDALRDAKEITKREFDAKKTLKKDASPELTSFTEQKIAEYDAAQKAEQKAEKRTFNIDPAIPEKVRKLMEMHEIDEWDIQNVVASKGYMPYDMPIKDYPSDFVDGWLIPYFDKVAAMAKEARDKAEIPYN